ncbi:multicopper oxidase family protein [Pseudarthrobacter siccitolerans]|uniref:Multicopper oxidase family protein n=1 Tax=Pseudarthrobacter siccitolerans TaxID=861266 RepID=A0A024H2J2_9MICC|nr:multicopper oxidase family protein [Pseudarthrobacter siccitolerans]CCQ46097.1 multicopper oxidase family protein [Pseudarthrobacter siccitolerans]
MKPISRRQALLLGGLGLAGTVAGGAGLVWTLTSREEEPVTGSDLAQPSEERSTNGHLQVRLEAAPGQMLLAGRQAAALGYNGGIPGPTLRVRAGDVLKIGLVNKLTQATNLHVHGLHVSPVGNGDNIFVSVDPGSTFDYEYNLPEDHPPGVYWYHPHYHGIVADQIFAGLFGAIIVEDLEPIESSAERVLVISDTTLDGLGNILEVPVMERVMGREGELILVNGQSNPQFSARPGQRERWRIINTCVSRYLRLRLDGQQLQLLGMDSGRFPIPETVDELLLIPGNRADLLVTTTAGDSVLRALYQNRGGMPGMMGPGSGASAPAGQPDGAALATLRVAGDPVAAPAAVPAQLGLGDLRSGAVAARRQIVLAAGMGMGMVGGMMSFTIDGREFNKARTDTTVAAGNVEEWTLTNTSPMDHPFHLHVWPMQIVEENGQGTNTVRWQDVVNVPAFGFVKVRVAFRDFRGRSVYHCHILDHEDLGMMGAIEVR